jgi:LysR family hydrogen peroxide-inducible transcriptional activator
VLEESTRIKEIADAGKNQLQGPLKLGVIFTVAPYLLPDLIPALVNIAPDMPLDIEENLTVHLEEALRAGRLDVAIIALPFSPPGIVSEFLYEEPFQIVVPRDHKWVNRKNIDVCEIAAEKPILLNIGHCFRDQVLEACPELHINNQTPRTNSLETIRNMVASGLGISVLPRDALTPKYHSNLVVSIPFTDPVPFRHIALAYRKSFPREKAIAAVRAAIIACRQQP